MMLPRPLPGKSRKLERLRARVLVRDRGPACCRVPFLESM